MINEGIPLSPVSESKPKSDTNSLPLGVKATDEEIANLLFAKVAANIVLCSINMSQYGFSFILPFNCHFLPFF